MIIQSLLVIVGIILLVICTTVLATTTSTPVVEPTVVEPTIVEPTVTVTPPVLDKIFIEDTFTNSTGVNVFVANHVPEVGAWGPVPTIFLPADSILVAANNAGYAFNLQSNVPAANPFSLVEYDGSTETLEWIVNLTFPPVMLNAGQSSYLYIYLFDSTQVAPTNYLYFALGYNDNVSTSFLEMGAYGVVNSTGNEIGLVQELGVTSLPSPSAELRIAIDPDGAMTATFDNDRLSFAGLSSFMPSVEIIDSCVFTLSFSAPADSIRLDYVKCSASSSTARTGVATLHMPWSNPPI
jgi:hypothetical protein